MNKSKMETDVRWKAFYRLAGVTALLIVLVGLTDTVTSMLGGAVHENSSVSITDWFALFATHPLNALGNLGLFNILTLSFGIPLYLALFNLHREDNPSFAGLAALLFVMGTTIYIASNTVFSMLALSSQYALATEAQKPLLEAAGRALLAQGADLTPGTFMGFLFSQIAGLMMALVLLRGRIFSKVTGWLGVVGFAVMLVFFSVAAFIPTQFNTAIMISAPGGLLLLAYNILLARRLFQLASQGA
ncbi:MAG: DUF4386 family protein [Anaerolineales bacterium]